MVTLFQVSTTSASIEDEVVNGLDGSYEAKFAQRLTQLIEGKDMKQVDLAKYLNVTKTTVSRYCNGRIPDAETLDRMAQFFGVTIDYLMGRVDDPHSTLAGTVGEVLVLEALRQNPTMRDMFYFLRGRELTAEDAEAVIDLLEARRLRRERENREKPDL